MNPPELEPTPQEQIWTFVVLCVAVATVVLCLCGLARAFHL